MLHRSTQWIHGKVVHLEGMVSVHWANSLGHDTFMLISYFDTDFASQMKLTKLPSIQLLLFSKSFFLERVCIGFKYMIIKHQLLSTKCAQLRNDPEHDPYDNDHKRAIVNNKYTHFTSHESKSRKVWISWICRFMSLTYLMWNTEELIHFIEEVLYLFIFSRHWA